MDITWKEFDTLPSTNLWAKKNAASLPLDQMTVVWANKQTAGYGQRGRMWSSGEEGNIALTVTIPLKQAHGITLMFALACSQALGEHQIPLKIRWPNDLMLDNAKIGGALGEFVSVGKNQWLMLGFGFNVSMKSKQLALIDQSANSLENYTGKEWDPKKLAKEVIEKFALMLPLFLKEGLKPFKEDIQNKLIFLEEEITFDQEGYKIQGILKGITSNGHLIMDVNGQKRTFITGRIQKN